MAIAEQGAGAVHTAEAIEPPELWIDLPRRSGYDLDPPLRLLYGEPTAPDADDFPYARTFGRLFLILGLVPAAVFLPIALVADTLVLDGDDIGLAEDFVLIALLIVLPLVMTLLKRLLWKAGATFTHLQSSINKSEIGRDRYAAELERIWQIIDGKRQPGEYKERRPQFDGYAAVKYSFVAVGFAFWVYSSLSHYFSWDYEGLEVWAFGSDRPLSFAVRTGWEFVIYVFVYPLLIYKIAALVFSMNSYFRRIGPSGFRIRAVAPDGAAGLGLMGRLALGLEVMLFPFIVVLVVYWFVHRESLTPVFFFGFGLFLVFLIVAFFVPLQSAHTTMRTAKERALETLESEFNHHYDFLISNVQSGEMSLTDDRAAPSLANIEKAKYLYEETEKMPVWPFDLSTLSRFAATIVVPTVIVVVGEWLSARV